MTYLDRSNNAEMHASCDPYSDYIYTCIIYELNYVFTCSVSTSFTICSCFSQEHPMCGVYCEHTWHAQQAIHQFVVKGGGDVLGMILMREMYFLVFECI